MTEKKKYDSTVARIAGNLLSGMKLPPRGHQADGAREDYAEFAVAMARAIVEEAKRTEPEPHD